MSEKKLTADQLARIEKIKQEAIKEVEKIPEPEGPRRNVLDGGGHPEPYYSIGKRVRAEIKAIMEE